MGESQGWCACLYNEGNSKFSKSLYVVGREVVGPYFMKTSPILPTSLFQSLSNLPLTSLSPPTPTQTALSVVLFLWLNGWLRHIWCAIFLNDSMDLHISGLRTLVPEGPLCVFYATKFTEVWLIIWFFTSTPIWYYTHINTQTYIPHSGASRLTPL